MTSNDIANKVKNEVLETYPQDGINIVIPAKDNYAFQLTSSSNELNAHNNGQEDSQMSVINLKDCESLLKTTNNIPQNSSLVILKYEKLTGVGSEKSIQYEIYNPNNFQKLDLSICSNTDISIDIPISVEDEIKNLYDDLKEEGYDLFDKNSKFYLDICTPFTAENGADILLADRLYYFFSKVANLTTCPSNCQYSTFSIDTKYLSCQCEVSNDLIDVENSEKFIGKMLYSVNDYALKYTSYKTLKCYKLVFSIKHFIKNAGSIIILILIFAVIGFLVIFLLKGISPIKVAISKLWFNENDIDKKLDEISEINIDTKSKGKNKSKSKNKSTDNRILGSINKNPPKRVVVNNMVNKSMGNNDKIEDKKLIDLNQNKSVIRNNINNNKILIDAHGKGGILKNQGDAKTRNQTNTTNNDTNTKKHIRIDASGTKSFYLNMNIGSSKKLNTKKDNDAKSVKPAKFKKKEKEKKEKNRSMEEKPKKSVKFKVLESISSMIDKEPKKNERIILDDYELNHLDYLDALKLDDRNYCKIYCSILKRDQLIMNTFFACDDYNLYYIKAPKFIFILCTLMTINAFLFNDKSFHKLFISGVNYYFNYQVLQIVLSVIITYVVEVVLCYLTHTDKYVYEIKSLPKNEINSEQVFNILKCIRKKLITFYAIIFAILLFYWYSVSAFCAVYPNTQKIYLIDCLLSFIFLSLIPFITYAIVTIFRVISLRDKDQKKFNCLYKVGQLFPIF